MRHRCLCHAARDTAAKLCGIVVLAAQPATTQVFLTELAGGFADQDIKKHKFEMQDGYLAATGYVLAQSMTGMGSLGLQTLQNCSQLSTRTCQCQPFNAM